jgi:DNA helicase HerA-like ATPase
VKDVQESESEIGFTVGDNSSDQFRLILNPAADIRKWDYVQVRSEKRTIVGRVQKVLSGSDLLKENLGYEGIKKYVQNRIDESFGLCVCDTIGCVIDGKIASSRYLIRPGLKVEQASREILEAIFGINGDEGMDVGTLIDREDVRVSINVNGLRRHLAIVAQTGAGKSHTAGVIMEELIKKGGSIVVLDPHADYVLMRQRAPKIYQSSIKVFRTPLSSGRYTSESVGIIDQFTIRFSDLEPDEISEVMGIREGWTNLRKIVEDTYAKMGGLRELEDFMASLEGLDATEKHRISGRMKYLNKIRSIFANRTTSIADYLSPGVMSVLDLSGMDQFLANYFAYRVINEIFEAKVAYEYEFPVFIFIEEAHNFITPGSNSQISQLIKKIASEGRKFGIFLVVITQRPGKIDQDVLSQCNSQIILRITNPIDKKSLLDSAESISDSMISDLSSLGTGEAVLVGEFVKMPVIAKIRSRETAEGGGDIDITSLLAKAREAKLKKIDPAEDSKRIRSILGEK